MGPKLKKLENYSRTPPSQTGLALHGTDEEDEELVETACSSDLNMRKNITSTMSTKILGSASIVYDKLMRYWIKSELGVDIPPVPELIANLCWGCGEEKKNLIPCRGKISICFDLVQYYIRTFQVARLQNIVTRSVMSRIGLRGVTASIIKTGRNFCVQSNIDFVHFLYIVKVINYKNEKCEVLVTAQIPNSPFPFCILLFVCLGLGPSRYFKWVG